MERRLAAILLTDIVGYSRLMGLDENRTIARQRAHRQEVFDPKISEHGGRIVKSTGDGLLVEFTSGMDAVKCAVETQNEVNARDKEDRDEERIQYRIGINLGDIVSDGDDILGNSVNVAARLEGLAKPGGICISSSTYEQVRDKLDYAFEDLGEQPVKNIPRPIRAYSVATQGASSTALQPIIESPRLSIAVLPFTNLSGDVDQDYFADALTEDLTVDLSRISGSFVISRSTAETYRNQTTDRTTIARELSVRYLLEGNVRKASAGYRVNVQLTDAETGQQMWSQRYDKPAGDMYIFQDEVTGLVARALNLELKDAVSRQIARGRLDQLDATDFTLRAWAELWTKPQTPETNDAALTFLNRALSIELDHAEANAVAAYAYARAATYGWGIPQKEALQKGFAAGEKSVALDPKNADAVYALAFLYFAAGENLKAQELLHQCIELNRNHAPAYFFQGLALLRLDQPDDAIPWFERAFVLSPRDPLRSVWHAMMARAYLFIGQDTLAVEAAQKGIAANRTHPHNHSVLAAALAHLDRLAEAHASIRNFQRVQADSTVSEYISKITSDDAVALRAYERLKRGLILAGLPETRG